MDPTLQQKMETLASSPSDEPSSQMADSHIHDPEKGLKLSRSLTNGSVQSFSWENVSVAVQDRKTKQPVQILTSSFGSVTAGNVVALMGPSGSGKTTLLNVLAKRTASMKAHVQGRVMVNGRPIGQSALREVSSYVEQEDAMIGSLTVRETIDFAARLSLPGKLNRHERKARVEELIEAFGLQRQADTIVGTPLRKGVSGGQKRRLSVASQLVTSPKILFLDEPTSGLDSAASYEVMRYITGVARKHHLVVIASIHQPSTTTFALFDKLMLLSEGKTCFFGPTRDVDAYFARIDRPIPLHINPAEFLLDMVNRDFTRDTTAAASQLSHVHEAWTGSTEQKTLETQLAEAALLAGVEHQTEDGGSVLKTNLMILPLVLLHRNYIKSYRDFLAYGTRVAMYTGLAVMMGTVWLRLSYDQSSIQPFITAIFFGGAFMSFMAVAYVPSIIEDLHTFRKERANGLYGPLPFSIANALIGIPWLFLISIIFSVITYWLSHFRSAAGGFWMWELWLFLDLLAAEGMVVLVSSLFPIFVVSLAITAFANGLWMCVDGFLVPMGSLNVFWKYVFHYIDYQAYVFQGMMVNQFQETIYDCDRLAHGYQCMYASDLEPVGKIRGTAVLEAYHYSNGNDKVAEWVGIMLGIIAAYRLLGYLVLVVKRH